MANHYVQGDELRKPVWIEIREILMKHWDPIGVCDEPFATDEYESYIPKIMATLRDQGSVEMLMDYLDEVETKRMGYRSQRERGREAAQRLLPLAQLLEPLQ